MKSIITHYKINPDGTLRFVGNETVEVEEHHGTPAGWHTIDAETMQKIGEIAYNGCIAPDEDEC